VTSTPTKRVLVADDHPLRPRASGVIQTAARRVEARDLPILGTRVNEVPPADIATVLQMPAYRLETRRWEMVQRIRQLTTNGNGRTMPDLSQPQRRPRRDEAQDVT
jgi:hypothetical protein